MSLPVTWLLPTRQAAGFLQQALSSIAAQTYRNHRVLAWDNGSTDETVEILREWIPRRLPGRVVADSPFDHLGDCLAAMVEEADTELLARMDADDVCHPKRLEKQVAEMTRRTELVGCGVQEITIDEDGVVTDYPRYRLLSAADIRFRLIWSNAFMHPGMMLRRSAVLAAGNYASLPNSQDYDLWFRLTEEGPLCNLPERLLYYRKHSGSITSTRSLDQWPGIHREFVRKYHDLLYPGSSFDGVMLVWNFLSKWGSKEGDAEEAAGELLRMAIRARRAPAWRNTDFFSCRTLANAYRSIAPSGPGRWAALAAMKVSRAGVGIASAPLYWYFGSGLPETKKPESNTDQ